MEDMFPALLQKIKTEFEQARLDSKILEELLERIKLIIWTPINTL